MNPAQAPTEHQERTRRQGGGEHKAATGTDGVATATRGSTHGLMGFDFERFPLGHPVNA